LKLVQFSTVLGFGVLSPQNSNGGLVRNFLGVLSYITVAAERLAWNDWLPKLFKNTISPWGTSYFQEICYRSFYV